MENVMIYIVIMIINNKILLQSLYLKNCKKNNIFCSSIEDSEVVLVLEYGLKKLSSIF
jgi:hypothetical protein